jgi:hypothetical protein
MPAAAPALGRFPPVPGAACGLERALRTGQPLERAVDRLIGLGPGLTPAGDDVLAGVLVALAVTGDEVTRGRLAAAVLPRTHRTTVVSAGFLRHAADGRAVPELARYVVALVRNRCDAGVVQDLERVGGTSGPALAYGARVGLRVASRLPAPADDDEKAAEVA